ncbi:MAG: hypothetical protein KF810_17395 [Rhizobiaceae bacterium]|nr:hypothetical protein [Rhizobiaceae bacterium]
MATTYVDQISGSGSPPVPVDPVTGAGETVAYKAPCRLATTGNITLSGLQTVDGETTVANDRVLVKAQTDETHNGIWIAQAGSWFRARDFDQNRDITKGTRVTVIEGSTLAGKEYQITTSNPIALGTDDITFAETLSSNAGSSAAAAEAARDDAVVAKDAAVSAAGTATSAAGAASSSAGNAATSESNASSSAGTATAAAGTATAAAGAASTSAGNAATSETNAANSAIAAAASAASIGFTKDSDGTMAANSNAVVPSQAAVVTFVAAAVAGLRNGVSSAFDTLAEIATELGLKAPLNSPALTGNPTAPTQTAGNNTTRIATTAFVTTAINAVLNGVSSAFDTLAEIATELGLKAPLNSPALTGTPTAPTASGGTNTTQIATTAFVLANGGGSAATTSAAGIVELATNAEVATGTDTGRVPSVASIGAHQGMAKAWVAFNGEGTVAIQDSYNVSSITDNGTGLYTVNFDNAMANANYAVAGTSEAVSGGGRRWMNVRNAGRATGSVAISATTANTAEADAPGVFVIIYGD